MATLTKKLIKTPKDQRDIKKIIFSYIKKHNEISWKKIMELVSKEYKVKNWLHVRSPLQDLINEQKIKRSLDIESEIYEQV